jgi:hypothetical protein
MFSLNAYNPYQTGITVIMMVLLFSVNHWKSKLQKISLAILPLSQMISAYFAHTMRNPRFILIPDVDNKVTKINTLFTKFNIDFRFSLKVSDVQRKSWIEKAKQTVNCFAF